MRITTLLILAAFLQVSATTSGQKVTLSVQNISFDEFIHQLKKQTGYSFLLTGALVSPDQKVSITANDLPLEKVLDEVLAPLSLTYQIDNKFVYIIKSPAIPLPAAAPELPPHDIHGQILTKNGEPLAGANVTIKRTGRSTITNAKGEFALQNAEASDEIVVSFVGYAKQIMPVNDRTEFVVYMEIATNEMDKVVIQAYGTTTQRLATGNIATVSAEQIERQPVMNPLAALEGQVPGVVVTQNNGYASAPFKIEIRGRSVINPNLYTEPLYIVDGVPLTVLNLTGNGYAAGSAGFTQSGIVGPAGGQSPFFSINPGDIESITVLKDADATAIYGSRGADGVIIITTKKGKPGKSKLNLNVYQGVNYVTQHYKMLNTQQYVQMRREAFENDNIPMNTGNAFDLLTWDTTRYTNWQKEILGGEGKTTDFEASLSGGDVQNTYRIAGAYHRETSMLNYSGAEQRGSLHFDAGHKSLNQKFSLLLSNYYSYSQSNLIVFPAALTLPPDAPPVFDQGGQLNFQGWQPVPSRLGIFSNVLMPYVAKTTFLNSGLTLKYEVVKGLTLSSLFGYSNNHNSESFIMPIVAQDPSTNPTGVSTFGNNNRTEWIVEPQANYKLLIGKNRFDVLLGGSVQTVTQDGNVIQGVGYVNDNLLLSIANAPSKQASDVYGQYKYASLFARINYSFQDKYIINASARRDGSSRFGADKQYGNFGSVGAAWIFTEEKWIKNNLSFLSFGKFRGSYGLTGRDGIGDYQYLTQWSAAGTIPYQGIPAYIPLQHANPNLQWEENKKLEGALDLGFLHDRISLEVAVYRNRSGNQLLQYILPAITGFTYVTANFPATVQNSGWESTLRTKVVDNKDFKFSINFNIGINKNKLIAFPGLAESPYANAFTIGQSLNIVKVLHSTGVDPQTGQYTFLDKNHDGVINTNFDSTSDLIPKDLSVKFDGGCEFNFQYKKLNLSMLFIFRKQERPAAIYNGYPGQLFLNQSTEVLNHWQKPGDVAKFARYTTQGNASDYYFTLSDGVYSNGSYIRMRNLSLSYDLSSNWLRKAGLQDCFFYIRGQNLFLITKYEGIDPDTPSFGALPPQKSFVFGIQFNF